MTHYEFHEYANIFPLLEGKELEALRVDIEANGQINKIILYQGKILDGRNRYAVCEMLGIEPEIIEYPGDDPLGLVLSQNLHRRHLTERQRAMVAAKIANLPVGRNWKDSYSANLQNKNPTGLQCSTNLKKVEETPETSTPWEASPEELERRKLGQPAPVSQSEAAEKLNVSTRSVADAVKVLKNAIPEVIEAVESGKLAVSTAATLVEKTPEQQRETLAKCEKVGSGRLGKDGKLRPAKYAPRKKTVAKGSESEESDDYIDLPYNHNGEFIKFALPIDCTAMCSTITNKFQHESRETRERIVKEFEGLAVIVKYLVRENYIHENQE